MFIDINIVKFSSYSNIFQKDYVAAATELQAAVDLGWYCSIVADFNADSTNACFHLGLLFEQGLGVERNIQMALKLYKQAAEVVGCSHLQPLKLQDNVLALNRLASFYFSGEGVPQNPILAAEYFTKAAVKNDPEAQNNLAIMYDEGIGVEQNFSEAISWFKLSANQGNTDAMFNLALMYMEGRGTQPDSEKAARLLSKAGQLGHTGAQLEIKKLQAEMVDI